MTNDDGIYAPGLAGMEQALRRLGDVYVVAPAKEQSGVSHSITFLTPLLTKKVRINGKHWGWAVDGSPADCVKLGISEIMPSPPDLVVSGINGGLNCGINILYSGTVGAAAEGALYGITSVAVSLEYSENALFHRAGELAAEVIERILENRTESGADLYNINIPQSALLEDAVEVKAVGMDVSRFWESFEHRTDPVGRSYYWLTGKPDRRKFATAPPMPESDALTDLKAVSHGYISVTPLHYDRTFRSRLEAMQQWDLTPAKR